MYFPDDFDEDNKSPHAEEVEGKDGKRYMMLIYKNPKNVKGLKDYPVNGHIVVAGCNSEITDGGKKLKCERKQLYTVMHPKKEWEEFHVLK